MRMGWDKLDDKHAWRNTYGTENDKKYNQHQELRLHHKEQQAYNKIVSYAHDHGMSTEELRRMQDEFHDSNNLREMSNGDAADALWGHCKDLEDLFKEYKKENKANGSDDD